MICPKCFNLLDDDVEVCSFCGEHVSAPKDGASPMAESSADDFNNFAESPEFTNNFNENASYQHSEQNENSWQSEPQRKQDFNTANFQPQENTFNNSIPSNPASYNTYNPNYSYNTNENFTHYIPYITSTDKVMAVLSYFGFLALVPLFFGRKTKFVKTHLIQGISLGIVKTLLSKILSKLSDIDNTTAYLIGLAFAVASLFIFIMTVIGIVRAIKGSEKHLTVCTPILKLFKL